MDALLPLNAKIAVLLNELLDIHCLFEITSIVPTILAITYPPYKKSTLEIMYFLYFQTLIATIA